MSKLASVRAALQGNTNIQIVAVNELNHFPHRDGFWTHTVDFIVAPNQGIYTGPELQAFMDSLLPGLEATCVDRFHEWDTSMRFGKLYFDEDIGSETTRREITLFETDFLPVGVVQDGKAVFEETEKIQRRTWVSLYPDQEIAMARARYAYDIPRTDLLQFQRRGKKLGFVGRICRVITG
ncbi:MAG: hypothetical protein JWL87_487 [Candidatus Adlerbacteria bacterium]|nr:hypothetical protein [Candidatus Adlerbacteria bacterium]